MGIITVIDDLSVKIRGEKVIGRIDKNIKLKIVEKLARKISEYSKIDYSEIFAKLIKGDIKKIEHTRLAGARGIYCPSSDTVYLDDDSINTLLGDEINNLTAAHEFIHKLQFRNGLLFFQGKEIRGVIEGATEYITQEVFGIKKASKKEKLFYGKEVLFNQKESGYFEIVAIMKQLDIILGNNLISNFALTGNKKALKEFQNIYGKELFEKIRKGTNKLLKINGKEKVDLLQCLQNEILYECYNKKFTKISNAKEGIALLKELKKLELARGQIEGDNSFKNYYIQKYNEIIEYAKREGFSEKDIEDIEDLKYKKPEFYKIHTEEEINKKLEINSKLYAFRAGIEDISRLKRFQCQYDGNTYEIMCIDNKPAFFSSIGAYENFHSTRVNEKNDYEIKFVGGKKGKINLNINGNGEYSFSLDYEDVHNQQMSQIELGFNQDEYEEFIEEKKEEEKKSWISRIKKWIDKKRDKKEIKALPKPNTDESTKSWELSPEAMQRVTSFYKQRASDAREKDSPNNEMTVIAPPEADCKDI